MCIHSVLYLLVLDIVSNLFRRINTSSVLHCLLCKGSQVFNCMFLGNFNELSHITSYSLPLKQLLINGKIRKLPSKVFANYWLPPHVWEIKNYPLSDSKLLHYCDVVAGKFDGIYLTSSNPNQNGQHCPFVACERLYRCENSLS